MVVFILLTLTLFTPFAVILVGANEYKFVEYSFDDAIGSFHKRVGLRHIWDGVANTNV